MLTVGLLGRVPAFAQTLKSAEEENVAARVEAFRAAQSAGNAAELDELCAAALSYGHSDGRVEDKATFVANATSRKSRYLSLAYQEVSIRVVDTAAIVRLHAVGEIQTADDGRKSPSNLRVLMNWQKQRDVWRLLSRQSSRI
jgi:ketosteroid isomerase-like protein